MFKSKKILAVVPARGGSKGIPLKNLRKINGKSLIQITSECIQKCSYIDHSVISSDYDEIIVEAKKFGLQGYFKRPKKISGDNIGDIPVLIHALIEAEKQTKLIFDIIIMLQPTCPARYPSQINEVIEKIILSDFETVWTINKVDIKFHPDKQLKVSDKGNLKYFTENGKSIITRQELKNTYMKNGIAYALTRDFLLKKEVLLGEKAGFILNSDTIINIDTIDDLKFAELMLNHND